MTSKSLKFFDLTFVRFKFYFPFIRFLFHSVIGIFHPSSFSPYIFLSKFLLRSQRILPRSFFPLHYSFSLFIVPLTLSSHPYLLSHSQLLRCFSLSHTCSILMIISPSTTLLSRSLGFPPSTVVLSTSHSRLFQNNHILPHFHP